MWGEVLYFCGDCFVVTGKKSQSVLSLVVVRFINYEKAGPWGDEEGDTRGQPEGVMNGHRLTPCIPLVHL